MHDERTVRFAGNFYRVFLSLGAMSYSLYIAHNPILVFISAIWTARESVSAPLALAGTCRHEHRAGRLLVGLSLCGTSILT